MKAADAWRAKLLVDALDQWPDFAKELRRTKGEREAYRAFSFSIGDLEDEGPQPDAYLFVDDVTGRAIAAAAKKIIETRLKQLGVKR